MMKIKASVEPGRSLGLAAAWVCFVMMSTAVATAQDAPGQEPRRVRTLSTEKMDSGFIIAPDVKFTEVDGRFANLAGVYGGWWINRRFLVGGGGYFLTNRKDDFKMSYGGALFEYFANPSSLVNVSVRGLLGVGSATLATFPRRIEPLRSNPRGVVFPPFGREGRARSFDETFFVAEPQADVIVNVTERLRLGFGGGYRFIGGADGREERLRGLTGNVALKLAF